MKAPVAPWTTPWTGEETGWRIGTERWWGAALQVLQQAEAPGVGRPLFKSAHMQRQRRAVLEGRCDVCGGRFNAGQARVVLAEPQMLVGSGGESGHVMAPSHRACAALAARRCPHVRRQLADGSLMVTVLTRYRLALAFLNERALEQVGLKHPGRRVAGHAKLVPKAWMARDADWLLKDLPA